MNQNGKVKIYLMLLFLAVGLFTTFSMIYSQVATTLGPYGTDETNIQCQKYQVTPLPTGAYLWYNSVVYPTPTFDPQREQVTLTGKDNTNDFITVIRNTIAAYAHPRGSKIIFNATATATTTNTATNSPTPSVTSTPTNTATNTATPTPTNTATPTPTVTPNHGLVSGSGSTPVTAVIWTVPGDAVIASYTAPCTACFSALNVTINSSPTPNVIFSTQSTGVTGVWNASWHVSHQPLTANP